MDAITPAAQTTRRRWRTRAIMLSVPLLVVAAGVWVWLAGRGRIETDNAYVRIDKVAISTDVTSRVAAVLVHENQPVKRGQLLVRLAMIRSASRWPWPKPGWPKPGWMCASCVPARVAVPPI